MRTRYIDPFDALFGLQKALEAHLTSDWLGDATGGAGAFPPINVFRKGDDFVAVIELSGASKDSLEVQAKANIIRISGEKLIKYDEKASIHRRERVFGKFDRSITLPVQVNPDGIKAQYLDGVLTLFIPRAESDKPRAIRIN
jgi:HSP20 family protein